MREVVLQERVTLDEAMLSSFETYPNGCSFTLRFDRDGSIWVNHGCYLLINLLSGHPALLAWFIGSPRNPEWKRVDGVVRPETILELKRRKPCERCGGFLHESPE